MKNENFIHQELFVRFLLAALLPIAVLVAMMQLGSWQWTGTAWRTIAMVVLIAIVLSYLFSRSYRKAISIYRAAQHRLEEGDFTVRVNISKTVPWEVQQIGQGFNRIVTRMEQMVERTKQVAEEQRLAELSALEAQIDPHFLYNTLDAINWKAIENEQYEISELLGALADIFRHTVQDTGGMTTLGKALEWSKQYILLQSVKSGKEPELIVKVPEELKKFGLHKLLLQPFVENAVKYAFQDKKGTCTLLVEAKMIGEQLHIIIEDNGMGMNEELVRQLNSETEEMHGHVGVANVRKRMKLYYGEEATVYFESVQGCYTRVHLFIPVDELQG